MGETIMRPFQAVTEQRRCSDFVRVLTLLGLLVPCLAQNDALINRNLLNVNEPRPLAKVAKLVELRFGIPINYEDAPYMAEEDVVDQADAARKAANPSLVALIPRPAQITINIASSGQNVRSVLETALENHRARNNPGTYGLEASGKTYTIVPLEAKSADGRIVSRSSPLGSAVTVSIPEGNGLEVLTKLCESISKASNTSIKLGTVPVNAFLAQYTSVQANGGLARQVLADALVSLKWKAAGIAAEVPQHKYSWSLYNRPRTSTYTLNIRIAMVELPAPAGGFVRQPIRQ